MTHGDHPPLTPEDVAVIRGLLAEKHRTLHHQKNALADRGERDRVTDDMRTLEKLGEKLGGLL